jgi:hypothetical protein
MVDGLSISELGITAHNERPFVISRDGHVTRVREAVAILEPVRQKFVYAAYETESGNSVDRNYLDELWNESGKHFELSYGFVNRLYEDDGIDSKSLDEGRELIANMILQEFKQPQTGFASNISILKINLQSNNHSETNKYLNMLVGDTKEMLEQLTAMNWVKPILDAHSHSILSDSGEVGLHKIGFLGVHQALNRSFPKLRTAMKNALHQFDLSDKTFATHLTDAIGPENVPKWRETIDVIQERLEKQWS